jgi:CP family cyanate transporter-like MFS transporter
MMPDPVGDPYRRWWPNWRVPTTWVLGSLQGGFAAAYLGANTFLPDFLRITGRTHLISISLTMLNAAQLPASLIALLIASKLVGRRDSFVVVGVAILASLAILLLSEKWGPVIGSSMLGFFLAFAPVLIRALPPTLVDRADVHRLSAGMFAIGFVYSFVVALLGGIAWDISRIPAVFFLPVVVGILTVLSASFWVAR